VLAVITVLQLLGAAALTFVRILSAGAEPPEATAGERVQVTWVPAPGEEQAHPATVEPVGR